MGSIASDSRKAFVGCPTGQQGTYHPAVHHPAVYHAVDRPVADPAIGDRRRKRIAFRGVS